MEKKPSKLETSINWIKPDKVYPKKSSKPLMTLLNSNKKDTKMNLDFSLNPINNNYCTEISKSFDHETSPRLLRMKDLCPDDKQRIGNLIKELAKVAEEKNQLEKLLEEERKLKDNKIKEVIRQHQILLNEKDKLLIKYTKTQEKLEQIKRHQKLMKLESKSISIKPNKVPIQLNKDQQNENSFNVHKSSTPVSQSPRNLSPIPLRSSSVSSFERDFKQKNDKENDLSKQKFLNGNENFKKTELIKQRLELMTEQEQLRELMDQQEKLLKEKQDEIIMQQQLHRERLEKLAQIRNFELEQQHYKYIASSITGLNSFNQPNQLDNTHEDKNTVDNHNNSVLIEKIAQKIYKQLKIKRQVSTTEDELLNASSLDRIRESNEQHLFKGKNTEFVKTKSKQEINENTLIIGDNKKEDDDDLEESKLIEDLFFINNF